jgi:uncharacterized membrane protein YjjP (DUF1212 family)
VTDDLGRAGGARRISEASPEIGLILRLGQALHQYGYPAPYLESALTRVAERFGVQSQFFSTPTSLFCSFGSLVEQDTYMLRVEPGSVDLGKLARVHELIGRTLRGELEPGAGVEELERIVSAPPLYPRWLSVLSFGFASGGASLFLGGGPRELGLAFAIGLVVGALGALLSARRRLTGALEPVGAGVAALLATLAAHYFPPASVYIVTLAGLIVLLPGFTLTIALTELATRHLASGTARLAGAVVVFLTVGFGVAVGNRLGQALVGAAGMAPTVAALGWTEWLALLLMPFAVTVLLRAQPRDAPWIFATGFLAVVAGRLGASLAGGELGSFFGALAVGVSSNLYARWIGRPAAVTLAPGILMLVPGAIGFRSLSSLLDRDIVFGMETMFRMAFVAMSLVAGLLLANAVAPPRRTR